MSPIDMSLVECITSRMGELSERTAARYYRCKSPIASRYATRGPDVCLADIRDHLEHFAVALAADEPALLIDHVQWSRLALGRGQVPDDHLVRIIEILQSLIGERCPPPVRERARAQAAAALDSMDHPQELRSHIDGSCPTGRLAADVLESLLKADCRRAARLVQRAVSDGFSLEKVYLDVLGPLLYEVGRLWQTGRVSVTSEHYCCGSVRIIMLRLLPPDRERPGHGGRVLTVCAPGELHDMGLCMLCHFLEARGWDVYAVGANVPGDEWPAAITEHRPDLLAVSVTMVTALPAVEQAITNARIVCGTKCPPVMVGGRSFQVSDALWRKVGADNSAPDAGTAVYLAEQILAEQMPTDRAKATSQGAGTA